MAASLNAVERALKRILVELEEANAPCALIGGLAVSARVEPRTTRDVDLAVSTPDDAGAEQLVFQLQVRCYVVGALLEQARTGRLSAVRLKRDTERFSGVFATGGTAGRRGSLPPQRFFSA